MRVCVICLLALGVASGNTIIQVSPGNMGPWAFRTTPSGGSESARFVYGPGTPPLGNGSLNLNTGADGSQSAQIRNRSYVGDSPSAFIALGYSTYQVTDSGNFGTYISIDVQFNNSGNADDEINFSPQYQNVVTGNPNLPDQGALQTGVWQTWNALEGGWWSNSGYGGAGKGSAVETIAQYLQNTLGTKIHNTNTTITSITIVNPGGVTGLGGVKVVSGFGNTSDRYNGYIDAFYVQLSGGQFLDYDFESNPEPATFLLLGAALLGMIALRRRQRAAS